MARLTAISIYCFIFDFLTNAYIRLCGLTPLETGPLPVNKGEVIAIRTGTVNFYIYKKDSFSIALDTGFSKLIVKRELLSAGVDLDRISAVFLSHSDFDHVGGLLLFKNAAVYLSRDEEQMITQRTARKFKVIYNGRIKKTYTLLKDNDEIAIGPIHIKAIETPGHTPGAISYLIDGSILFIGDAFRILEGKAQPLDKFFNTDQANHIESIKKLAQLENIKLVLTGHRGFCDAFDESIKHWRETR